MMSTAAWVEVKDGNDTALHIFDQHYSRYIYADGRKPKLFVGPGEKCVLVTPDAMALFVWRKFISTDGQQGVNCAVFRNEGPTRSSKLILLAEDIAFALGLGARRGRAQVFEGEIALDTIVPNDGEFIADELNVGR